MSEYPFQNIPKRTETIADAIELADAETRANQGVTKVEQEHELMLEREAAAQKRLLTRCFAGAFFVLLFWSLFSLYTKADDQTVSSAASHVVVGLAAAVGAYFAGLHKKS